MARWANGKILMLLLLLVSGFCAFAQDKPFDEKTWKEVTKDVSYIEKEEAPKKSFDMPNFKLDINPEVVKYTFFTIVFGVLLYFLIRYLLSLQGTGTTKDEFKVVVNTIEEAEENPMQADLENLIQKLVANQQFREATRAHYLLVLQHLYKKSYIDWQKPKTNFDYLREVQRHEFYATLQSLTTYFERIWYGSEPVSAHDFFNVEPEFLALSNTIRGEKRD